jgi:tRNA-binding protein
MIDMKSFANLELRVGTIVEVKEFPEAQAPAYKLKIDFGPLGIKWSSAQLTQKYGPEDLKNRKIVAVVNMGVKKIASFRSEVLVLGVPDEKGAVVLLEPDGPIPNGARVR